MPIVTEESQQPKRPRAHGWVPALALVALLPVGLFAWSWFQAVSLRIGPQQLTFGAVYGEFTSLSPGWHPFLIRGRSSSSCQDRKASTLWSGWSSEKQTDRSPKSPDG